MRSEMSVNHTPTPSGMGEAMQWNQRVSAPWVSVVSNSQMVWDSTACTQ
jgi:hypothetical protein